MLVRFNQYLTDTYQYILKSNIIVRLVKYWLTDETICNPLSNRTLPISTNPPISEQFVHDPPLCPNFKTEIPTHPLP